jgi:methyl-accepting chemotaxis protein
MTKNLKFSNKVLIAASLIVLVTFAAFTASNDYQQKHTIQKDLDGYLHEMGELSATNIDNWLSGKVTLIENLAQSVALDPELNHVASLLEQKSMAKNFLSTYLGDTQGIFTARPFTPMPASYDPRVRPWYQDAVKSGSTTLTAPYVDASTGQMVISIATPVHKDGNLIGVIGGDLTLDTLVKNINSLDFSGRGYAYLVDEDGTILVHPNKERINKKLNDIYTSWNHKLSSDVQEAVVVGGNTRMVAFIPVKGLPSVHWYIAISLDKEKSYSALVEFRQSALIASVLSILVIIGLLGMFIRRLMRPLNVMSDAMRDIAEGEGDLTKRLTIEAQDEFGMLGTSFNQFVDRIHTSIREVSSATELVNEVALRVVSASNSSMANSDEQVNRTTSVAAAINELGAAAQEIARNAAHASHQASDARGLAEDGQKVVEESIKAMNKLSEMISASSTNIETVNANTVNIGKILDVITSISQQTNLLALNAAIEAARAGEAGRGFAVVADEVRNLAHRTQESAQQVQKMIEELQHGAQASVETMAQSQRHSQDSVGIANQAGDRLGSVTQRIGEIDSMNQSVAAATEEQTSVVETINIDITEINTLNQEGVENLQSTLRACKDLEQQALRLKELVGSFRI